MKRLIKLIISLGVHCWDTACGALLRLSGRKRTPRCVVLYYHGVSAAQRAGFARQMDQLRRYTEPIDAESLVGPGRDRYSTVTFDDGFVSVLQNALPELEQRQIPATLFVPTGSLGTRPTWITNPSAPAASERVLSELQLKALHNHKLISIGSHSVTHPNFVRLDDSRATMELKESKERLESIVGQPVTLFSFPHGACDSRLLAMAKAVGYRRVFTITPEPVATRDEFSVGRVAVDPEDWAMEFRLKLMGAYRWLAHLPGRN